MQGQRILFRYIRMLNLFALNEDSNEENTTIVCSNGNLDRRSWVFQPNTQASRISIRLGSVGYEGVPNAAVGSVTDDKKEKGYGP